MKLVLTTTLLVVISFFSLQASTYYIDQVNGNNSNSGTTQSAPWKTFTKVTGSNVKPGDQVLLKSGQIWREQLYINFSGTEALPITIGSYGSGEKPVISGSDLITGFTQHSGSIWKKTLTNTLVDQVFFNEIRGKSKSAISQMTTNRDWCFDASNKVLYVYSTTNPSTFNSPGIEAAVRNYSVYVNTDYIIVRDLQVEKTASSAVTASNNALNVTFDNLTVLQWTADENASLAGVVLLGTDNSLLNSTFGKSTGNDLSDQNWAGYLPVLTSCINATVAKNKIYHNSTENENSNGTYAYGIRVSITRGRLNIYENYIYHTGSNGIYVNGLSRIGDILEIHDNKIEYTGQAGISLFKTRGDDGTGGKGYVYKNEVAFANRLGGDVGGNGNQASGLHFNDGIKSGTIAGKPYMKWYCYDNIVHDSFAPKNPNGPDSDGIALDYNANGVEVYRNIIFNNSGKGMYAWNASNCKISYNILYGNDTGITLTALKGGVEQTNNNLVYNNTFYKNYNGDARGPNYNAEIYFGLYGTNCVIKNNIVYASAVGYGLLYGISGASGNVSDYNLLYSENGAAGTVGYDGNKGRQTFTQWKTNHPEWDQHSVTGDPMFTNEAAGDFSLKEGSPAINKGVNLGFTTDIAGIVIKDTPDIGAYEYVYVDRTPPVIQSVQVLNDVKIKVAFSEKVVASEMLNSSNYTLNNGVSIESSEQSSDSIVILNTSVHNTGSYILHPTNIHDEAGNVVGSTACGNYSFTSCPADTVIKIAAETGALSGSAALKVQAGSLSSKVLYFTDTNGSAAFNVQIPKTGKWFMWARFYYGNSSKNNSFFVNSGSLHKIIGDDTTKYNIWHYDGYMKQEVALGTITNGNYTFSIAAREPGQTVMVDQILLTMDESYAPQNEPSVMPVTLVSPANNAIDQPVQAILKWNKDNLATGYGLQVARDSALTSMIFDGIVTDTVKTVTGLDFSASYYWRVKSTDGVLESDWSETRLFTCKKGTVVLLNANSGTLSGNAGLGSMTGMKNTRCVYFNGTLGGVTLNFTVPETGKYYVWARMYYKSSGTLSSFYITVSGNKQTLGGGTLFDQWHWDGYQGSKLDIGTLQAGQNSLMISGIAKGLTLWVDQVVVTNDPNFVPNDDNVVQSGTQLRAVSTTTTTTMNAMEGTLSGSANLGTISGSENTRSVYFTGKDGGVSFDVNVSKTAQYYVWARTFAKRTGGKNSFYLYVNGINYIIGDNDSQFDKWNWDGYKGVKINVGILKAGKNNIRISGREPGTTLWVDKVILTSDPDLNPNIKATKDGETSEPEVVEAALPTEYLVSQNYPNPFNPSTTINFAIPVSEHVSLKVYDILGKEVAQLVNSVLPAGYHQSVFDAKNLASGIYIYQLKTAGYAKTVKMQLLK